MGVKANGIRLPRAFGERAEEVLSGRVPAAQPRDAATVILVREGREDRDSAGSAQDGPPGGDPSGGDPPDGRVDAGDGGLQVYMLRRVASMAFAPGAYVFPGGSVDPRDGDRSIGWAGPPPAAWAEAFGADEKLARELVCAAVRETFEESGVLLAGPTADSVVADTRGEDWEADRLALLDRSLSFAELLDRRGLVLRSDLLRAWSHWITPVIERKRYDTRFFVAAVPEGQRPRDVSGEADRVAWMHPGDAAARARKGELTMLPPTVVTLLELAAHDSVPAVLAAERRIHPRMPEITLIDGEAYLVMPEELR